MGKFILSLLIILAGSMPLSLVAHAKNAMEPDLQHVNNWNQFADQLHIYHKYLLSTHEVTTEEETGGYAGMKEFYNEISYRDQNSNRILSKIQWETDNPTQIHTIEVFVYDKHGTLKSDYLASYLPGYRNAPIQTLINLHYKNDELHSFRQFDASGARIYEYCSGKFFGEPLLIALEEDDFYSLEEQTMKVIDSEEYLACFQHTPHIPTDYLSPLKTGHVPRHFLAKSSVDNTIIQTETDVVHRIEELTRLINKAESPEALLIDRASHYFSLHEFEKAVEDYNAVLARNDALDEAYFGRGMAKGRLGLLQPGIADLSIYIERNPTSSLAHTKRGVRYIWAKELDKAEADLIKATLLDPNNAEAFDDLGVVNASKGDYKTAISHFQRVVEIDPGYQKGFHNLAMAYHITQEKQKALQNIDYALAINPQDKNSLLLKGEILNAMGMEKEAKLIIERAEFLPEGNWSERFSM